VQTLAICHGGRLLENVVYNLRGTPCEGLINRNLCYYPSGIQELFPQDVMIRKLNLHSYLGAPLINGEAKPAGLIAVLHGSPMDENFVEAESILKIFAARAGVELERVRAERALRDSMAERKLAAEQNEEMVRRLRALTARMESVREEERTNISREIHDELGQQLTAMRFDLSSLKERVREASSREGPAATLSERFTELTAMVDATIQTVRRIATELRPGLLDTFGLIAAIEWLAEDFEKRTRISCVYEGVEDLSAGQDLSTTVFRICQEALTNVARHSGAIEAIIRLRVEGDWLSLEVTDNGIGVSLETLVHTNSLGVLGMRERARIAGGQLDVVSVAGHGVTVRARLPLQRPGAVTVEVTQADGESSV
jgi:signal transduction histidine kinase